MSDEGTDAEDQSKGGKPDTAEDKSPDWRKLVNNAVWTVIGGLLGALVTGYFNLLTQKEKSSSELKIEETKVRAEIDLEKEKFNSSTIMERQKLDEDLIKLALQSPEIEKRKEALTFMAQTGLISDPGIQKGVQGYLAKGNPPPRLLTTEQWVLETPQSQWMFPTPDHTGGGPGGLVPEYSYATPPLDENHQLRNLKYTFDNPSGYADFSNFQDHRGSLGYPSLNILQDGRSMEIKYIKYKSWGHSFTVYLWADLYKRVTP